MAEDKVPQMKEGYDREAEFAHVKRDGYRLRITRNAAGVVKAWTRKPKDWTELVKELPRAQTLWTRLSEPCILHAEVWREKTDATSVITHVKAADPTVKLSVFAVERALPPDAPLQTVSRWCIRHGLDFVPYFKRGARVPASLGKFESLKDLPIPTGDIEGYVFKRGNMEGWQKWTPVLTASLVVVGLKPGTRNTAFNGLVGSMELADATGRVVCNAQGFNYATRCSLGKHTIGQIVEVKYKGIGTNGKLRQPRFTRFRPDQSIIHIDTIPEGNKNGNV